MRNDRHYTGYIRTQSGTIMAQISDSAAVNGFYIVDRTGKVYDGGIAHHIREWSPVTEEEITPEEALAVKWVFKSYKRPKGWDTWMEVSENKALIDECPRHNFSRHPEAFGASYVCECCGGAASAVSVNWYNRGLKDAKNEERTTENRTPSKKEKTKKSK